MHRLREIRSIQDIPEKYRETPIGLLLQYQNLDHPFASYTNAQILIGMCMDNRKHLHIPENFAYIIRAGGANLRHSEFKISYAIAVGGVRHIVLIGHNQCGMVNLAARREQFVRGLVEGAGWTKEQAEEHFMNYAPLFEIGNEVDFVVSEAARLNSRYPKVEVVPLIYAIETNQLCWVE